jgi:phage terminase small subunit
MPRSPTTKPKNPPRPKVEPSPLHESLKKRVDRAAPGERKILDRQRTFALEYLVDFNAAAAAERAGFARASGASLLRSPNVRTLVDQAVLARERNTEVRLDQIIHELARVATSDIGQAYDESGQLLPVDLMPPSIRRCIAGIDVDENFEGRGEAREKVGYTKKIKLWSKTDAASTLLKLFMMAEEAKKRILDAMSDEELEAKVREIQAKKELPAHEPPTELL